MCWAQVVSPKRAGFCSSKVLRMEEERRDAQLSIPESRAQGRTSLRNAQLESPGSVSLCCHLPLCHWEREGTSSGGRFLVPWSSPQICVCRGVPCSELLVATGFNSLSLSSGCSSSCAQQNLPYLLWQHGIHPILVFPCVWHPQSLLFPWVLPTLCSPGHCRAGVTQCSGHPALPRSQNPRRMLLWAPQGGKKIISKQAKSIFDGWKPSKFCETQLQLTEQLCLCQVTQPGMRMRMRRTPKGGTGGSEQEQGQIPTVSNPSPPWEMWEASFPPSVPLECEGFHGGTAVALPLARCQPEVPEEVMEAGDISMPKGPGKDSTATPDESLLAVLHSLDGGVTTPWTKSSLRSLPTQTRPYKPNFFLSWLIKIK